MVSIGELLSMKGITELNPVQKEALKTNFQYDKKNLVVSSPTGSGKTLLAELAIINSNMAVYTCPLKALASEKYKEFKYMEKIGKKVVISIGDLDSNDPWLGKYDVIITTNEKLDSLMRHNSPWLKKVDLLVVDEVHLIDSNRGPTLESIIMKFKYISPKTQIIALSATIPNSEEIADWLRAEVVVSNWRPVKLIKGVYTDGLIETTEGTIEVDAGDDPINDLVKYFLKERKNVLIFTQTRRGAEATAERIGKITKSYEFDTTLKERVLKAINPPTKQCKRLSKCLSMGSAFHHAGLVSEQRELIEEAFKNNKIKVICATPTLAMGVNLPADVVIMKSIVRYTPRGVRRIPKREFFQCGGRAGRPGYSNVGYVILTAKSNDEKEVLWEEYINGSPEVVYSQLGKEPVLRSHVLASISTHMTPNYEKLNALFMHSFFAHQYKDQDYIESLLKRVVKELVGWGFVKEGESLLPTELGRRVSELYIDPYSAVRLIQSLERDMGELGLLYAIVDTNEMRPYLSVRKHEDEDLWESALRNENELGFDPTKIGFEDYELLEKVKTSLMLRDWINEKTEEEILESYNVAPGVLRGYISNAEWMAYSASELARILEKNAKQFRRLSIRLRYGVKEELLSLVTIRGIGRIRARRLFDIGVKKIADIKRVKKDDVEKIVGKKLASNLGGINDRDTD